MRGPATAGLDRRRAGPLVSIAALLCLLAPAPIRAEESTAPKPSESERSAEPASLEPAVEPPAIPANPDDVWSRPAGRTRLRLIDLGLDVMATVGSSTESGVDLAILQAGAHDPRQRGFTLNQIELSFIGAVDPYVRGEVYLVFNLGPDGETNFEVEEAFMVSQSLPFGLQDLGFQIEGGTYFTDFGRINTQHPHVWTFIDQPIVASRFLGGEGLRGPGALLAWLMPLPWYSELRAGVQNARGEIQVSYLANLEVFIERPIGGRPFVPQTVSGADDLTWAFRWANALDVTDTWNAQLGLSAAIGPNATGEAGSTQIYGADLVAKWRPLTAERGWPFFVFQSEFMYRVYQASAFVGNIEGSPAALPADDLLDWGLYVYGAWGFHRGWLAALRYEYATGGGGPSYFGATPVPVQADPWRAPRHRVSPLIAFHTSEYFRLRLQYNYDHASYLYEGSAHSVWFGFEFSFGAHPAHSY